MFRWICATLNNFLNLLSIHNIKQAIFLKFLAKADVENLDEDKFVLELDEHEQLEIEDIVRALDDTSLNTAALYNSSNSPLTALHTAQLYFGRGFEERLELELDKYVVHWTLCKSICFSSIFFKCNIVITSPICI